MPIIIRRSPAPGLARWPLISRPGFTLVELLVSLVLLDLALLALAASSAAAAKQLGDARTRSRAAGAVRTRLEWAASQPCAVVQSGTTLLDRGIRESWSLGIPLRGTRLVVDTVEFLSDGSDRATGIRESWSPC